jgi:hypothetical protein
MNTTANPANFEGQKPVIDQNDAVMLLIDHQSGLFQTVGDIPVPELRTRAAALAMRGTARTSSLQSRQPAARR